MLEIKLFTKKLNSPQIKNSKVVLKKFIEHHVVFTDAPLVLPRPFYSWIRPEQGVVKINCDAAVVLDHSFIAIVARDWRGDLIFSMSKRVETNLLIQAEVEAINLATCVAVNRGFKYVVVESDAKTCIDALKAPFDEMPRRISSITTDNFCGHSVVRNLFSSGVLGALGKIYLDVLVRVILLALLWM